MFARIICDGAFLQKSLQYRQTFKGMSSYNYELINELEGWCLGTLGPPPPPPPPLDPPLLMWLIMCVHILLYRYNLNILEGMGKREWNNGG